MKKNILILLGLFSLLALAGGTYLAYSFERSLSEFKDIIVLHHVENQREHLLMNIQRVKIDLYSQKTVHPESTVAVEGHISDMEKSIASCLGCHHEPEVDERLDDLRIQVGQYKKAIVRMVSAGKSSAEFRRVPVDAQIIGDSLISKVETMVVATSEKLRDRTEVTLRRAHATKIVMLALLAAGPAIMIIFAVMVIRGVTGPVTLLLQATRRLKRGDLEHRIVGLRDEFGELALAFNDMAGALRTTMSAIEESEKRYRLLFESAADAIFILDAEGAEPGRIVQANPAAARMHGYSEQELQSMRVQDLDTPESSASASSRIERILNGEWLKQEMYHRRKDGTVFPVEVSAGLLETVGHKFILAMDRDITERKRAEHELQRTERIRVSGELATGLAHEIKNPLAGIKVSMEVLSHEAALSAEDRDVLDKVIGEIKRIEYLMSGLLSFAHPPKPQLLATDVNGVLETVAELALKERSRDKTRATSLVRDLQADLPEIMADPMQLKQIFMNLILNAIDAMPEGGTLMLRTRYRGSSETVMIEIADTGRGIDAGSFDRIFRPFFSTKPKGTGLGLSITKRLVEEHGGTIQILSNSHGAGVTCTIQMPVRQPEGACPT